MTKDEIINSAVLSNPKIEIIVVIRVVTWLMGGMLFGSDQTVIAAPLVALKTEMFQIIHSRSKDE